jgi:hypothetical protein
MGQLRKEYGSRVVGTVPIYFGILGGRLFGAEGVICVVRIPGAICSITHLFITRPCVHVFWYIPSVLKS